ncbi:putative two-component system response regulator [Gammaproteobacteria bacterium]
MNEAVDNSDSIVIVDDNPNNLHVLSGMLQQHGYRVRPALDGEVAIRSILSFPPNLVLLDVRMPGIDGYEVCRRLKSNALVKDIPIIFISALQDMADKVAAFQAGGVDYITKPFQLEEVLARVHTHLNLYRLQRNLEDMVDTRTRELQQAMLSLSESQKKYADVLEQTIQTIVLTMEKRDAYTAGHQARVSRLVVAIAQELGIDAERINGLRLASMVHDIGKIHIPAEILNRPGRISDIEFSLIKTHAQAGYDITRQVSFPWPVADIIWQHHERMDGSGYPRGLKGEEILLESRLLTVADVVEAMASHRPYRPALGLDKALEEIKCGAGRLYDQAAVSACLRLFGERNYSLPQ